MKLTHEARQAIRQAIDAHKRARLAAHRQAVTACIGCGTEHENYSRGCRQCMDRRRRKRARPSPVPAELRKQRFLDGLCAGCGESVYDETPGCRTCYERARARLRREGKAA